MGLSQLDASLTKRLRYNEYLYNRRSMDDYLFMCRLFLGQYYTNKDWHKDLAYKSKYKGSLYANGKFYKVEEENSSL